MKGDKWRAARLVPLALLLGWLPCAAAAPEPDSEEDAAFIKDVGEGLARSFTLSKGLALDPALRRAGDDMAAAHLTRIRGLLPAWLKEERALQGKAPGAHRGDALYAVAARAYNELALWQVEPGDSAYESAVLDAIRRAPLACRMDGGRLTHEFARRLLRIQAMPQAQQEAALRTERTLLEHWGKPRVAIPAWPDPLPTEAALAAAARGAAARPVALPPILAQSLLTDGRPYRELAWDERCVVHQWWLRASLAQGASAEVALAAFRYGTLLTLADRFGGDDDAAADADNAAPAGGPLPYPKLAARYGVQGATTIRRSFDAKGKPLQASVTARRIEVPGIRGVRPVLFEDVFDAASIRHGMAPGSGEQAGPPLYEMVWSLEPRAATNKAPGQAVGAAPAQTKGGKR